MRRLAPILALLILSTLPLGAAEPALPEYVLPETLRDGTPPSPLAAREVAILLREVGGESEDAWRVLGGIGRPAIAPVVAALPRARSFGRALLMTALAESGVPEIRPVLEAGTRDPAWAVREAAAAGLARTPEPAAARALADLVDDPSWRVRRTAAVGIRQHVSRGTLPRDEAVSRLLGLARDPDRDVRFAALRELGHLHAEEARDLFLDGYRDGEDREREVCLDALTRLTAARDDLLAALEKAMEDASDTAFLKAAETYAELAGGRLLESEARRNRLLDFLRGSTGSLVPVTKVFEKVGREAVPILLDDLRRFYGTPRRNPPPQDPAQPVLDLVQTILGEEAAPLLEEILLTWEEALPARRYAVLLARRYHATGLTETLTKLYPREGFADLRSALLDAIEAGSPPDLARWVDLATHDRNFHVRRTAQAILRRHPEIDLTESIVLALRAEDSHSSLANDWLGLLAAKDRAAAYEGALDLLDRPDPEFRARGAAWIRVGEDREQVLARLVTLFETEDGRHRDEDFDLPAERLAAVRASVLSMAVQSARFAGGADALPLLARAATDPDPVLREKALEEIRKIDDPRSLAIALQAVAAETEPGPLGEARRIVVTGTEPEAVEQVRAALTGEDDFAREGYLSALAAVEDAPLPGIVAGTLLRGEWGPEARLLAVKAIRARRSPDHLGLFVRLLRESGEQELRQEIVTALGELRDTRAVEPLLSLLPAAGRDLRDLEPADQTLAIFALDALAELGDREAVPRLLDLLSSEWLLALTDRSEDRRHYDAATQTLAALGRMGDPVAIAPLLNALFTPELYHWFTLLEDRPAERSRTLLGSLIGALVRFRDEDLVAGLRAAVAARVESGEIYRIDEGYLLHLSGLLEDPRQQRIARNHPRRDLAAALRELVLDVVPRGGPADLLALESLSSRAGDLGQFGRAAELRERANVLARVLDPVEYEDSEALRLARADFLRGLTLIQAGSLDEGRARYDRGKARDPEDPDILNLHAWWLAVIGQDLPDALESALEAGRRSGSSPYILDTIGWVLHRMGRHEEAAWRLYDAVKLDREQVSRADDEGDRLPDPLLPWHLAAATSRAGRLEAAADWIAVAASMDDTLADAARTSPDFAPLREKGLLEPALVAPE